MVVTDRKLPIPVLGIISDYVINELADIPDLVHQISVVILLGEHQQLTKEESNKFYEDHLRKIAGISSPKRYTVLMEAAYKNNIVVLNLLLNQFHQQAKVDAEDAEGKTAFHYAIKGGHTDGLQKLLHDRDHCVNKESRDIRGFNALHMAVEADSLEIMKYFFFSDKNFFHRAIFAKDKNNKYGKNPIQLARALNKVTIIRYFMTLEPNPSGCSIQ